MKKSLIALALFASAALSGAASASSYNSPTHFDAASPTANFQKLRCVGQCIPDGDGIFRRPMLTAGIGSLSGITKMDVATLPTPLGKHQELFAKQGEGLGGQVPKTGQFTVGGQYVAGAHLSPTWEGDLHL